MIWKIWKDFFADAQQPYRIYSPIGSSTRLGAAD